MHLGGHQRSTTRAMGNEWKCVNCVKHRVLRPWLLAGEGISSLKPDIGKQKKKKGKNRPLQKHLFWNSKPIKSRDCSCSKYLRIAKGMISDNCILLVKTRNCNCNANYFRSPPKAVTVIRNNRKQKHKHEQFPRNSSNRPPSLGPPWTPDFFLLGRLAAPTLFMLRTLFT